MAATCRGRRREALVREPDAGELHVRFDERDVETEVTAEPLRHRQTKEAETDMFGLPPPRHISTPLKPARLSNARMSAFAMCGHWSTKPSVNLNRPADAPASA
jgi:hypothetical protein